MVKVQLKSRLVKIGWTEHYFITSYLLIGLHPIGLKSCDFQDMSEKQNELFTYAHQVRRNNILQKENI